MHYYFYLSKVQIRKNVLKYSNEVKIQQWKHVASGVPYHTGPQSTQGPRFRAQPVDIPSLTHFLYLSTVLSK